MAERGAVVMEEIKSTNRILTIGLIIAAFFLGSLTNKVATLGTNKAQNPAAITVTPSAAPQAKAAKVNIGIGNFPALGNKNAKVTVIEFADFRCPFCERYFSDAVAQIIKNYVTPGKVQFAFRNYAFLGPASVIAANAAECANEQGKFWEMHDYFYKNQPSESDTSMYTVDNLTQIAGTLGMNTNQFNSCLSGNKYQKNVDQDLSDGQKAGVQGTPATFVNGKLIVGACPFSTFDSVIKAELAGKPWSVTNCQIN
jgi:protein-disulfide isomerase